VIVTALLTVGCEDMVRATREGRRDYMADNVLNEMRFIRHEPSGLCFAIWWGGDSRGGPAMTTVPCESAEKHIPRRYTLEEWEAMQRLDREGGR